MKKDVKNSEPASQSETEKICIALGRKRDTSLEGTFIEAALQILSSVGYDKMTMDMVAAEAKAGKATLYRRWTSKAELVRDAIKWMQQQSFDFEHLPETGTLRGDLLGLPKQHSVEWQERKMRIMMGLGSFIGEAAGNGAEECIGLFDNWTKANATLMERAKDRGEIPSHANVDRACQVISAVCAYQGLFLRKGIDKKFLIELVDDVVMPILLHDPASAPSQPKKKRRRQ
jgi:AcrR family transcriptional regulator